MIPGIKQARWFLVVALSLGPGKGFGWQEQPPSEPNVYHSQTVLRATTRLVVVDVVATDSKGQPVSDLAIDDFTVLENGKPQKITGFSFQRSARPSESEKGALVKEDITNLIATIKAENYEKVMDGSFPCRRALDLKPGSYKLMLGVLDHKSRLMGITMAAAVVR